ncbi:MAG TPA: flagellar hook-associated protein FlgK [Nitrospirota bacterium]|nr:flagellar hook-associated protein FlgK [Nitrospirota bacterium]
MSVNSLYNIGESALIANKTALAVTSNNIANVNTPDYCEESVTLQIAPTSSIGVGQAGSGVMATNTTRSYNSFLEAQLLNEQQHQSASASLNTSWGQVQDVLNEAQGIGLSAPLANFFNDWNEVATDPQNSAARTQLLQDANTFVQTAQSIESSINDTVNNDNANISSDATQTNSLASQIAGLNQQIVAAQANGTDASNLQDQQDAALTSLAKLVDFTSYTDQNGSLTVVVGNQNLVSGNQTNQMTTGTDTNGNATVVLGGTDITSNIQGGDIGGLIQARNGIQTTTLAGLNLLVASLAQQVNSLQSQGYGLDGSTGNNLFTLPVPTVNNSASATITPPAITGPAALTTNEYEITFNAAGTTYNINNKQTGALVTTGAYTSGSPISFNGLSFTITGAVSKTDTFTIGSPLPTAISSLDVAITDPNQIAAAATAAGVPGDNTNANQIAQLANTAIGTLGNETFSGYYSGIVATVGSTNQNTSDSLTYNNSLLSQLQSSRDSVSAVSLDQEATNLMMYQNAYEAGEQVIKVAGELVQSLLALIS